MVTVLGYAYHYLSTLANILLQMERNCMILSSRWRSSSPLNKYVYLNKGRKPTEMLLTTVSLQNIAITEVSKHCPELRRVGLDTYKFSMTAHKVKCWVSGTSLPYFKMFCSTSSPTQIQHRLHYAGGIWKRRCHSENASNVFCPLYFDKRIKKRNNQRSFWIWDWEKLS